jgi:hypothetical protein
MTVQDFRGNSVRLVTKSTSPAAKTMGRRRPTFALWQLSILVGALSLALGFLRYAMARWMPGDVVLLTLALLSAASVWCCFHRWLESQGDPGTPAA